MNSLRKLTLLTVTGSSKNVLLFRCLSSKTYENIKTEIKGAKGNIGLITLNRPKQLNALSSGLLKDVVDALGEFDANDKIAATVITGEGVAFAAGADLKQLIKSTFADLALGRYVMYFDQIKSIKPMIAAVNGFAFGGGCELAMSCDIIYASEKAQFGQPEIKVGLIPGAGGTQRLTKTIGKSRTMEMVLTGVPISAQEALSSGLISKVLSPDQLVDEAIKLGEKIGENSKLTVAICKESVNSSFETTLKQGLETEKRLFHATFATNDRVEGMKAFIEKRKPNFTDS